MLIKIDKNFVRHMICLYYAYIKSYLKYDKKYVDQFI